jgi:hypothetical protein
VGGLFVCTMISPASIYLFLSLFLSLSHQDHPKPVPPTVLFLVPLESPLHEKGGPRSFSDV